MREGYSLGWVRHIHCVGIGGAGMSGIAEVLANQGFTVSGSDLMHNHVTRHLEELGVEVMLGHSKAHVRDCDVVVYSSAVSEGNIELQEAFRLRKPVVRRAEMLSELMRFSKGIAIAGTHGKTTTTSLMASVLAGAGMDPTYVIGGLLKGVDGHAQLGSGDYFVAEADESDASFLHLTPILEVITNIDADHLENYQHDYRLLQRRFFEFTQQLPFHGSVIACTDSGEGLSSILARLSRRVISYGLEPGADYQGQIIEQRGGRSRFLVHREGQQGWLELELNMPGRHNVLNALAVVAVADSLDITARTIRDSIGCFQGISRRCEVRGTLRIGDRRCLLIDDYAHHPRELDVMFEAVRDSWPGRRVVVVFQPHRYSRLHDLFDDFCISLSHADILFVLDVYAAGEAPISGIDSRNLCRSIRMRASNEPLFVEQREELFGLLERLVDEDDLLLMLGAGDISTLGPALCERYPDDV